jgi:hypothetical protein
MASTLKCDTIQNASSATANLTLDTSGNATVGNNFTVTGTLSTSAKGITSASLPAGAVIQVVNYQTGAVATGTTLIPSDDTIPQNTEGDEYMTLAITPKSATSKLKIDVVGLFANSAVGALTSALFQDSTANAIAAMQANVTAVNVRVIATFTHYMTSGTTSSVTFKVRAGLNGAGTTTFNGTGGNRLLGGVMASSITITEIAA